MIEREMYKSKKKPKKESPTLDFMRKRREEEYERIIKTENTRKGNREGGW